MHTHGPLYIRKHECEPFRRTRSPAPDSGPRLIVCPPLPSCIAPIVFAQALLPMYNVANGVDGWKR